MPINPAPSITIPGSSASAFQIIKSAMRLCKVLAAGEDLPGDQANDALMILNQMIDGWNAEQLMIYTTQIQDFPITNAKQTYTMGPSGDFDIQRPAKITMVSIVLLNNPLQPLERPIQYLTDNQWHDNYPIKNVVSTFPQAVYDDQAFPLRNLTFWPFPIDPNNFRCYSWGPLGQFASLTDDFTWPPGYLEALRYNLALLLADEWSGTLGQTVVAGAIATKARIKTANVTLEALKCDQAVVNTSGIDAADMKALMFGIPSF